VLEWRELKARVDAMADDLAHEGIGAGDRLSIWMSNRLEAIIAFLACSREGIACNPSLHKTYTCGEVIDLLTELGSKAILTENGWGADRAQKDFNAMPLAFRFCGRSTRPNPSLRALKTPTQSRVIMQTASLT
jgi:acyl-CoA synthetase